MSWSTDSELNSKANYFNHVKKQVYLVLIWIVWFYAHSQFCVSHGVLVLRLSKLLHLSCSLGLGLSFLWSFWFTTHNWWVIFKFLWRMSLNLRHSFSFFPLPSCLPVNCLVFSMNLCCSLSPFTWCKCFLLWTNIKLVGFMIYLCLSYRFNHIGKFLQFYDTIQLNIGQIRIKGIFLDPFITETDI